MRRLFILIGIVLASVFSKDTDYASPLVEVRAVFINCEPEEREDISVDTEELRFEREELFKHSVLQDCNKKMAVTVKIATDPEAVSGDEYIPIEHVFQGQNKRVRLLNPYVLRLQRGTLLQAYKLRKMDSVTGILENINPSFVREAKTDTRRYERLTKDEDQNNQDCELTNNSTLNKNSCLNKRKKRQEHNIVVEDSSKDEKYSEWIKSHYGQELNKNRRSPDFYASSSSTIVSYPQQRLHGKLNDDDAFNTNSEKPNLKEFQLRLKPWGSYPNEESSAKSEKSRDGNGESDWDIENTGTMSESTTKDSYNEEKYEKEFDVFEIGTPDLLYNVKIQLFEKLANSDGNTLWNDMTKGEPASVSTLAPEWAGQDLIIRYRPMEWIPREEYTLPQTNLCLLAPILINKVSEKEGTTNYAEKYIVLPKEDIVNIEHGDVNLKKRDENSSDMDYLVEQNELVPKRRVMIRTTRAIFSGDDDHYNVTMIGNAPFLTLDHHRTHHVQIDLEARADDNQLVPVGASGRIMTVVSDSSRRTRTTLTVQVTNTGLAAAKFRTVVRECGPDFGSQMNGGETFSDSPIVIPPRHTRSIRLDVSAAAPADVFHCLVSLVNNDDESVAVRDVTVKKGDRCFCVWHCECTCLSEDPKLLCREMSEAAQIAAGLSLRERVRHVRSACYPDVMSIDILVTAFGTLIILLFLGLAKAILGLMFRSVGTFGVRKIVQLPRKIDRYYESCLQSSPVVYDDEGWPVHPNTKLRTVRCISACMEFFVNLTFFVTTPCIIVCDLVKQTCKLCCKSSDVSSWCPSETEQKVYKSSHDIQDKKLQPNKQGRRCQKRGMKKWMTPEAAELSSDLWLEGLGKTTVMQPLLHEDFCRCRNSVVQQSCVDVVDSEGDETEYVLMQIQKSKESLARSQRKLCSEK